MTEPTPKIGQNGLFLRGKIHYELDSFLESADEIPTQLRTEDQYEWDRHEEEEELEHELEVAEINAAAAIAPHLLKVLTHAESTVVYEHIWEKKPFHIIAQLFPQHNDDGSIRRREGEILFHDHKWVGRRYKDAMRKMRRAANDIPAARRIQTTHHIPAVRVPHPVTERIASEQGEASRHSVRELVRESFHRSRDGRKKNG